MRHALLACAASLLLVACSHMTGPTGTVARAVLSPTAGSSASGTLYFTQQGNRLLVSGEVRGLAPDSVHGFHIHEKGEIDVRDARRIGAQAGQIACMVLGLVVASVRVLAGAVMAAGTHCVGAGAIESTAVRVGAGEHDVIGRSVVVHRDPDDFTSQPAGNSGPRLACGVIQHS